ncbi:MAG: hypothetical protein KDC67_15525 [Ignavibacteriae bacterium]|nr:hypothetical protein [Ignavibacteriota bacterium]
MDIIFITNEEKLKRVFDESDISVERDIIAKMEKFDKGFFCYVKNFEKNSIYLIYDGDGNEFNEEDKKFIIPLLKEKFLNDYFIAYHTNQSKDITDVVKDLPTTRAKKDEHGKRAKYYGLLPKLLTNEEELNKWVEEQQAEIDGTKTLNLKLNFLHKLLSKELDENLKKELENLGYEINYNPENHLESLKSVRDELLEII